MLAACGGNGSEGQGSGENGHEHGADAPADGRGAAQAACRPSGAALSLSANNLKFDKSCLAAPADQAFTIEFNNSESDQHNVAILPEHDATSPLFRGEVFPGPATRTYQVPPLKAGNYHFHCDVHPEMQGDFIVQ